jgi:hypothetical protein
VVTQQVMIQQHHHPARVGRIPSDLHPNQGSPGYVDPVAPRVETRKQLPGDGACPRVKADFFYVQRRLSPDHLRRFGQPFPLHRRAQDVMPINHRLQRLQKPVQPTAAVEGVEAMQQVGIALRRHQVVKQNPFLQRRQRVNVLHIGGAAGHVTDDAFDVGRAQLHQRQHLRRDGEAWAQPIPVTPVHQAKQFILIRAQSVEERWAERFFLAENY